MHFSLNILSHFQLDLIFHICIFCTEPNKMIHIPESYSFDSMDFRVTALRVTADYSYDHVCAQHKSTSSDCNFHIPIW